MEKFKFGVNEVNVVPNGIENDTFNKRRKYYFKTDLTYAEVEEILTNPDNLAAVQYIAENGDILAAYSDCVSLKVLSKSLDTGTYTAEFSTDATEKRIAELEATVKKLEEAQTAVPINKPTETTTPNTTSAVTNADTSAT